MSMTLEDRKPLLSVKPPANRASALAGREVAANLERATLSRVTDHAPVLALKTSTILETPGAIPKGRHTLRRNNCDIHQRKQRIRDSVKQVAVQTTNGDSMACNTARHTSTIVI